MKGKNNYKIILIFSILALFACKKEDTVKPLIALKGEDTVKVVLNSEFVDPGVTATDETDGDLSQNVAIKTDLNVNKVGFYEVFYTVSDEAGNVSQTQSRIVNVYNEAEGYADTWAGNDTLLYYGKSAKNAFEIIITIDSTINNNIIFSSLSSDKNGETFGEVTKSNIEFPEQKITYNDSLKLTCQGRGRIKDTEMKIHFAYYTDTTAEFRYVTFNREAPEE